MDLSVLIPYGGTDEWRERSFYWLLSRYAALLPGAQIVIGSSDEPFNRGEARNRAFSQSTGDVLLIADADTLFHLDQIEWAVRYAKLPQTWVIPYKWYYNLDQETTENILSMPPDVVVPDPAVYEHKVESWAGLLVMPREAYETVGGYDERFQGWGYEDNAFRLALDTLFGHHLRMSESSCLHLWHEPGPGFEQPHIQENRRLFRRYEEANGNPILMRSIQ